MFQGLRNEWGQHSIEPGGWGRRAGPGCEGAVVRLDTIEMLNALLDGDIDGFPSDRVLAGHYIETFDADALLREYPLMTHGEPHLMFSKATVPLDVVERYSEAIEAVYADGTFQRLNTRYSFPILVRLSSDSTWFGTVDIIGTIAFVTTLSVAALPIIQSAAETIAKRKFTTKDSAQQHEIIQTTLSISYPLAQVGNFFVFVFLLYASYYFFTPIENSQILASVSAFAFITALVTFNFYGHLKFRPYRLLLTAVGAGICLVAILAVGRVGGTHIPLSSETNYQAMGLPQDLQALSGATLSSRLGLDGTAPGSDAVDRSGHRPELGGDIPALSVCGDGRRAARGPTSPPRGAGSGRVRCRT